MRGVSAVVAVVLILLIVVSLAASSYVWFSALMARTAEVGTVIVGNATIRVLATMHVESTTHNTIHIRNTGTTPLSGFVVYINEALVTATVSPAIVQPGEVATISLPSHYIGTGSNRFKITTAQGAQATTSNKVYLWDDFEDGDASGWTAFWWNHIPCNQSVVSAPQADGKVGKVLNLTCGVRPTLRNSIAMFAGDIAWKDYTIEAMVNISVANRTGAETWIWSYWNETSIIYKGENLTVEGYRFGWLNESKIRIQDQGDYFDGKIAEVDPIKKPDVLKPYPWVRNKWYKFKLVTSGNRLRAYIDDVLIFDETDPTPQPSGRVQVSIYTSANNTAQSYFDNILVYAT